LTNQFLVIVQIQPTLFLGRYKWYLSNLVTPCGAEVLHDVGFDEDVRDLSGRDCDTLES
jgi:hypothetical protein